MISDGPSIGGTAQAGSELVATALPEIGARSVAGERIIFACPGPELEYWEDED